MVRILLLSAIAFAALPLPVAAQSPLATADPYGIIPRVRATSLALGADPDAMTAVVLCEDRLLLPDPIGLAGERGPFQIKPSTFYEYTPSDVAVAGPDDLDANITAGVLMHRAGLGYLWTCRAPGDNY